MPGYGPGVPSQVSIGTAPIVIPASQFRDFSLVPAPDEFESADKLTVERGSGTARMAFVCEDFDVFQSLHTLMTARTLGPAAVSYVGGSTPETLDEARIRVIPQFLTVQNVQNVLIGTAAAALTALDSVGTGWTSLGMALGDVTATFEVPEFTAGRIFYYSYAKNQLSLMLPDATAASIVTAGFPVRTACKIALKFAPDVYLVFANQTVIALRPGDRDGDGPRPTFLRTGGRDASMNSLFSFHDGSTAAVTAGLDLRMPFLVEAVGTYFSSLEELLTITP